MYKSGISFKKDKNPPLDIQDLNDEDELYESLAKAASTPHKHQLVTFSNQHSLHSEKFSAFNRATLLSSKHVLLWKCRQRNPEIYVYNIECGDLAYTLEVPYDYYKYRTLGINSKERHYSTPFRIYAVHYLPATGSLIIGGGDKTNDLAGYGHGIIFYKVHIDNDQINIAYINSSFGYEYEWEGVRAIASFNDYFIVASRTTIAILNNDAHVVSTTYKKYEDDPGLAASSKGWFAISSWRDQEIRIFKFNPEEKELKIFKTLSSEGLVFSSELAVIKNNYLASSCYIKIPGFFSDDIFDCIQIWNVEDSSLAHEIPMHGFHYTPKYMPQLLALPNGWLCLNINNSINIWNPDTSKIELNLGGANHIFFTEKNDLAIFRKNRFDFINVSIEKDRERNSRLVLSDEEKHIDPTESNSFSMKKRSSADLEKQKFSPALKFNLFYLYNLLTQHPQKAIFACQGLKPEDIPIIVKLLKYNDSIVDLDLSYNNFSEKNGDKKRKTIRPNNITQLLTLYEHPYIKFLNFSGNNICTLGFSYFFDALKNNKTIRRLNLSSNYISLEKEELKKNAVCLERSSLITEIDISQNYLSEKCDTLFTEDEEKDENHENGVFKLYRFSIFRTEPRLTNSMIDPEKAIYTNRWVVGIFCGKNESKEHAFLLMEGMRENGQLFLKKYEIKTILKDHNNNTIKNTDKSGANETGYAAVVEDDWEWSKSIFDSNNYYAQIFNISAEQGAALMKNIKLGPPEFPFSRYFPGTMKKYHVCLMSDEIKSRSRKPREGEIHIDIGISSLSYITCNMGRAAEITAEYLGCNRPLSMDQLQMYKQAIIDIAIRRKHIKLSNVNCVAWCRDQLKEIGITIVKPLIPLPSHVARGSSCLIL